jgi:hypothetical protein
LLAACAYCRFGGIDLNWTVLMMMMMMIADSRDRLASLRD